MDPTGQFATRFPLVARPRPVCTPLQERVADICQRAQRAERDNDLSAAAAVHNLAALIPSDAGLPDLARQWCRQHAMAYLPYHPLTAQAARHALEPMVNLARLHIRAGHGERGAELIDILFTAVATGRRTVIDGIEIPAQLTDTPAAEREVRRWLWTVLLATVARGLGTAGVWDQAHTRLRDYRGVGNRMLDGRQVAVIAHATRGDTDGALALLRATTPGPPWENTVTACLSLACRATSTRADRQDLLDRYRALDTPAPELAVFHTRLGLSLIDAIGVIDNPTARRIATDLIHRATTGVPDGYVARDLLDHHGLRYLLTDTQARHLNDLVHTCALDHGCLPAAALEELTTALTRTEEIITRNLTTRKVAM